MKWTESEFMELVQNLLYNFFKTEQEGGNKKFDKHGIPGYLVCTGYSYFYI